MVIAFRYARDLIRRSRPVAAGLCAVLLCAATPAATTYTVERSASDVTAKVGIMGVGSRTAQFPDVRGTARLERGSNESIDLDVTIDARTLTASDRLTRDRLRSEQYFWVSKYPTVRFTGQRMAMTGARTGKVEGTLTARGVSKPVSLSVSFDKSPADLPAGAMVTLTGTTRINRRDFGMKAHGLIVGKMVDITIKARLRPA